MLAMLQDTRTLSDLSWPDLYRTYERITWNRIFYIVN